MASLSLAPAAVPLSPQQAIDRVKQTICRVSSNVESLANLEQRASSKLNRIEILLREWLIGFVENRLRDLDEVVPDLLRLSVASGQGGSPDLSPVDECLVRNVIGKCQVVEGAVRMLANLNQFALLRDETVGEVN